MLVGCPVRPAVAAALRLTHPRGVAHWIHDGNPSGKRVLQQRLVNSETLALAFKGFKTVYSEAWLDAPSHGEKIAMTIPSASRDETYGWLGMFPQLREWIGQRQVNSLKAHGFTITNRKFESTVSVKRDDVSDDRLGVFKPFVSEMGVSAKRHPDELIFGLLKAGFDTPCFDGTSFFSGNHPVEIDGKRQATSNFQAGTDPAWFLLDTSRAVRPIIFQKREDYEFQSLDDSNSPHVFLNDEYLYGVRARVNAGFGLWQPGFGAKAPLNEENYAAARAAMMGFKSDGGRLLGVSPSVLIVPPQLESARLHLLNTEIKDGGGSNPWKGTAELIVTPYVAA
ncbi:Mu-like prophage major head subunit gpT family protein [Paracoccus sp. DMF-8]|uniref:Mu-like prophage major head subunit gpT family protein n=1 Tax=Paracoccus sp. DMF-8 TaxID=3019445 RepID=UPI0023E47549|nr:Mu-like prophage major head subunit gpT family protein [Paracoccus sp. DMF-8]MDF3607988.1 Mu-like prophage major head subunit gpT family protein [Paracoccus sp. DMF-8]